MKVNNFLKKPSLQMEDKSSALEFKRRFDGDAYLNLHPDVKDAGVDPLKHFTLHGISENRCIGNFNSQVKNVLFVDGIGNATTVYRCFNVASVLNIHGVKTDIVTNDFISRNKYYVNKFDLIVLVRVAWNETVKNYVKFAKSMGIPVVADFDDYVFEPSIANKNVIDGIRDFDEEQLCDYVDGVHRYRQTLLMADYATGSTPFLVQKFQELGVTGFHIKNSLERHYYSSALNWNGLKENIDHKRNLKYRYISYFSGSKTHQKDFKSAAKAISKILHEYDDIILRIYGELDLSEYGVFDGLEKSIEKIPLLPFDEYFSKLPGMMMESYICIAPLELESVFCQAKSELKYFEAGAFGVPVVASSTDTFQNVISNGDNGLVCSDEKEWYSSLKRLITDNDFYSKISMKSRIHALSEYGIFSTFDEVISIYEKILSNTKGKKRATWLVPGPIPPESGGHNSILFAAREMVARGYEVRMHLTCDESGIEASYKAIEYKFNNSGGIKLYSGINEFDETDVAIATHYTTALALDKLKSKAKECFYFVQDYEPFFGAVSTEFFQAEHSYKLGFKHISIGKWLCDKVSTFSDSVKYIDFWIDRDNYYIDKKIKKKENVITFFARPSMPRRCYDLGVAALSILYKADPSVEIRFYGEKTFPSEGIDFPYVNMGVLNKTELRDLYNESAIVLSFSTTNPSIATFEIMACGTPVLDLDVFDAKSRHFGYPAILSKPFAEDIAEELVGFLSNRERMHQLSAESIKFTESMPAPLDSIKNMIDVIEESSAKVS